MTTGIPAHHSDLMVPIRAQVVRYYTLLAGGAVLILLLSAPFRAEPPAIIGSYLVLLVNFAFAYAVRERHPSFAGALCSLGPLVLVSLMVWVRGGMSNPAAIMAYVTLVLVTGLVWNLTGAAIITVLSGAILGWFVATAAPTEAYGAFQQWGELVLQLLIVLGIVQLTLAALTRSHTQTLEARAQAAEAQAAIDLRSAHSQSIDSLGRLAGGVAHDFNNVLTVVSGTAELMRLEGDLSPGALADLERVESAAKRAAKLTEQLLAFGRKQVLEPKVLSLNSLIHDLRPLLERLIPQSIELRIECQEGIKNIRVDEARLGQIVVNLVSNASDAMPMGGVLTVRTRAVAKEDMAESELPENPGDSIQLSVIDTGIGIAPEARARMFEPFFTTKRGAGTGLGLPTVHGIVAQSGGHIVVESTPGAGSNFHVYFPECDERAAELAPSPLRASEPLSTGRILLAEDQPEVRRATSRMLVSLGYEVEEAVDGQDALERYQDRIHEFTFLVSDVIMPRMNGPELAKALCKIHPALQVLFLSGYPAEAITRNGQLDVGVNYLPKPFSRAALGERLNGLGQRRQSSN